MLIKTEILRNLVDTLGETEGAKIVEDEIVDHSRWSVIHRLVIEYEGKFFETTYSVGATEYQDQSPFDYAQEMVECKEVFRKEKLVTVYE